VTPSRAPASRLRRVSVCSSVVGPWGPQAWEAHHAHDPSPPRPHPVPRPGAPARPSPTRPCPAHGVGRARPRREHGRPRRGRRRAPRHRSTPSRCSVPRSSTACGPTPLRRRAGGDVGVLRTGAGGSSRSVRRGSSLDGRVPRRRRGARGPRPGHGSRGAWPLWIPPGEWGAGPLLIVSIDIFRAGEEVHPVHPSLGWPPRSWRTLWLPSARPPKGTGSLISLRCFVADAVGAWLHRGVGRPEEGLLPRLPAHDGQVDARRRGGHPLHPGDARPRLAGDDEDLHTGQHPSVGERPRHNPPGGVSVEGREGGGGARGRNPPKTTSTRPWRPRNGTTRKE